MIAAESAAARAKVEEVRIEIKRLRRSSAQLDLPAYMTEGAAGMDLCADADGDIELAPLQRALVPTGIAIALPLGFEAQIRPRSGLALKQNFPRTTRRSAACISLTLGRLLPAAKTIA